MVATLTQSRIASVPVVRDAEPGRDRRWQGRDALFALLDEPLEQAAFNEVWILDRLPQRLHDTHAHVEACEPSLPFGCRPRSDDLRHLALRARRVLAVVKQVRRLDDANEVLPEFLLQRSCSEESFVGGSVDVVPRRSAGHKSIAWSGPIVRRPT